MMRMLAVAVWLGVVLPAMARGATYYLSPQGDDSADGLSAQHPWKSCAKLASTSFQPGDNILLQRGGTWRERLTASASGSVSHPISYDAYGQGDKPRLYGSDLLINSHFEPAGANRFSYPLATQADSALVDGRFIPSSWSGGVLTITTDGSDPRSDGRTYTACTRGNEIFSNGKNHLVFRNLVVDETAGQLTQGPNQGYGVRIEGSTDVLVENCEAYRCGRHHFAAINSTDFVGRHLRAAYVVPNMPGDNTPYVSYADTGAPVAQCITSWQDISASHLENGHGGESVIFVSHGDHLGQITISDSTLRGKISFMSAPVVVKHLTLHDDGSIENFGAGIVIDGVTLRDSSAIDQYGSDGTIQNCIADLSPRGGGPTGYGAAIVLRGKAQRNVIRFNTLVTRSFGGICLAGENQGTRWYGNIFDTTASAIAATAPLPPGTVSLADYNCYAPGCTISGQRLSAWQSADRDAHSLDADPQFADAAHGDYSLRSTSPCLNVLPASFADLPMSDAAGQRRSDRPGVIGALIAPAPPH